MIAIDIGGSHIASVHIEDIHNIDFEIEIYNSKIAHSEASREDILGTWVKNIEYSISQHADFDSKIAMAIPGPFDYNLGIVGRHPSRKFRHLEGMNIRAALLNNIKSCKEIYFINDASSYGLGEYYYGLKEVYPKIIGITLGTGIGSAFIDQGELVEHGSTVPEGGEIYCLPFKDSIGDDYFSTAWFVKKCRLSGYEVSGVKSMIASCNPTIVKSIFEEFADNLAIFLTPLIEQFDAQAVVIGGNISKASNYFLPILSAHFRASSLKIIPSHLGELATCLGAARSMYNASI